MFKKLSPLLSVLVPVFTGQSADIGHSIHFGGGLGWNYERFNFQVTEFDSTASTNRKFDLGKNSPTGDVALGYRLNWYKVMTEIEIDYLLMGLKRSGNANSITDSSASRPVSVKSNGAFGGALKFGYYIKDAVAIYLGAGGENRKFKVQYTIVDQPTNSISSNHSQTAFVGRVGLDIAVNPYVLLGAEYRKAFYNGKTFTKGITTLKFKPETIDTILLTARIAFNLPKIK